MAFQFALEAVLRVRESIERREERALQSIQLDIVRILQAIQELRLAIGAAYLARERALVQTLTGGHLQTLIWEEEGAEQRLGSMLGRLQVLEGARDEQVAVYQAAHQSREMLTDMRTKQRNVYEREWLRAEQKRLDDIFMARRHRLL
jgi:flagellar export protein FliJ